MKDQNYVLRVWDIVFAGVMVIAIWSCGGGGNGPSVGTDTGGQCTPNCWYKECGDNGCGGSCGTCDTGKTCDQNGKCVQPTCTKCDSFQEPMINPDCQKTECDLTTCKWKVTNKTDGLACTLIGGPAGHCINGSCGQCNHNGQCEADAGEDCRNCKADCGSCCGNGQCEENYQENCSTCPQDCGCPSGQTCYNKSCCIPKTCTDLGWQCGSGKNGCGGQVDCGQCASGKVCQDYQCKESKTCGDGYCDSTKGEDCGSCPKDCGCVGGDVCFKNDCCTPKKYCQLGWDCSSGDDGCGGKVDCGSCQSGNTCQQHKCIASSQCGDGNCDSTKGEDCGSCPKDCGKCMDINCSSNSECKSRDCFDMSAEGIGFCSQDCNSSPCPTGYVCDDSFKQCFKSCQSKNDCDSRQDCMWNMCYGINGVIGPDTYILKVSVQAKGSWDAMGGQPDFEMVLKTGDGTIIGSQGPFQDKMNADFKISVPNWYLTKILVTLDDADISSNDYILQDKDYTGFFILAYWFGTQPFKPFTYTKDDKSASATVTIKIEKK